MRTSGSRPYLSQTPVPKMPPGLVDLMEGMTKEVLRKNPTDIYEFCAAHMKKLLEIRDGLAQEKTMPLKIKQANVQNQHAEKYRDTFKEKMLLISNYGLKENLVPEEELKRSNEENLLKNDVKIPVRHEMDLMEASEIEIVQEFINPDHIKKFTPAKIFESDNVIIADENCIKIENTPIQFIEMPKCFEIKERHSTDIKETTNADIISLIESTSETKLTSNIAKVKESEILEENQSNILDYTKIVKENIQASVINEMDMPKKNEINVRNLLQEEIHNTGNGITEFENLTESCPTHPNLPRDILKMNSDEHVSISHKMNELHTNEKIKNIIIDNNVASNDEDQKAEQKQITPLFDDTAKEVTSCEVKVKNDINEFNDNNHSMIEKQGPETREELNDCISHYIDISKEEVITIKMNEPNNSYVKNVHIDSNEEAYTHSTNENNSVCDNTNIFNNVKDLQDDHLEELHNNLHLKQNLEDHIILSENENYNDLLKMKPENNSNNGVDQLLITEQNAKETDVDKPTLQKINDIAPTHSRQISPVDVVIVKETKTMDNSEKAWGNDKESSNMDLETAAITIQKVFRSFLYKSRGSTFEDVANDENVLNDKEMDIYTSQNKERRPIGITRIDSVLQTVNEEKSLSLSTDDSSTLSSAATIIQAHVRGFLVRNKINSSKTLSMNSLIKSDSHPVTSSDDGDHHQKNKTVLNIHIVPEAENKSFTRDETVINSVDLSLDCSPPTSINLHPLGYDKSEPRKQLKREDAFQSISPPSNNSGKLSEDIDVREIINNDNVHDKSLDGNVQLKNDSMEGNNINHVVTLECNDSLISLTSNTQKQDATQQESKCLSSISPRSNNDGKLGKDVDVSEINNDNVHEKSLYGNVQLKNDSMEGNNINHVVTLECNDSLISLTSNTQKQDATQQESKCLSSISPRSNNDGKLGKDVDVSEINNDNVHEKSLYGNVQLKNDSMEGNNINHVVTLECNDSLISLTSNTQKQDATQQESKCLSSISPRSNNDGKLGKDVDVSEINNDNVHEKSLYGNVQLKNDSMEGNNINHVVTLECNDSLISLTSNTQKQDATQQESKCLSSISPRSNNDGKLGKDVDVSEINNDNVYEKSLDGNVQLKNDTMEGNNINNVVTLECNDTLIAEASNTQLQQATQKESKCLSKMSSDESDVVTPFVEQNSDQNISRVDNTSKLIHSGEFHDVVVPTKVTRSDTSVVRDFNSVLVYFLLWSK